MTFIDPALLESLGLYGAGEQQDLANQVGQITGGPVTIGSAPPPPPAPGPTTVGGLDVGASGRQILAAVLAQAGINTPEALAHINDLVVQSGANLSLASQLLTAEMYDPSSTIGKIVNEKYPEIQLAKQAGLQGAPLTVGDVLKQRGDLASVMKDAGLPPGFYDQSDDFTNLIVNGITPDILRSRINDGYTRVATADPAIRDAFSHYFGPSGDAALASYFLDPNKATPILSRQVAAAQIGGAGSEFGFTLSRDRALSIADAGVSEGQARSGFSNLQHLAPLFDESISEGTDLTPEGAGVDTQFNLGGNGQTELEQRLNQRRAAFAGVGGGAQQTTSGLTGLGSSRSR